MGDCGLLGADGEFALVFVAAEFALDGDMRAFGEAAGEIGEFPEGHAPMPLGARFPGTGIVLPGRLGGQREDREIGCVAKLLLGIAADETDESDSVEVLLHVSPFLPFCLGHPEASGRAAPKTSSCFSGGTENGGARTGMVPQAKQKLRRRRAPQKPRSSAETKGRTGNVPEMDHGSVGSRRRSSAFQNRRLAEPVGLEVNDVV